MAARMTGMVFERYPGGGGELLLALALADNAHDDGTRIFPSVGTLAVKSRQSERSVQYQLRKMERIGWLEVVN
ncbi:helix-turn-helix domain-containing protein, partial [Bacillus velezensis]